MLRVDDLHVSYGQIAALVGASLEVGVGEVVALLGSNGVGKTTTLNAISGLLRPTRGAVALDGQPIHRLRPEGIVRRGVVQVPEGRRIFSALTVAENLEMGAYTRGDTGGVRQTMEEVFELFPRLRERRQQAGGTLSGGEQQMLAVGRALMARPRLLLLDEPSLGLAPIVVSTLFETLAEINRAGITILLVEQNAAIALTIATRAYVMQSGQVVLSGSAAEIRESDLIRQIYFGVGQEPPARAAG
ncbi:MAG: ABC transporter ATP-binding protein [Chloroflexi bacterium]|nr:ABC transporter ATP-binding protein [Chloroflexota bacterium]